MEFFEAFDNRGNDDAPAFRVLVAIMNRDPGPAADVFVIGAFVGVLESSPSADIVQENKLEIDLPVLNIPNQLSQRFAVLDIQPAPAFVNIFFDDLQSTAFGILPNCNHLVAD